MNDLPLVLYAFVDADGRIVSHGHGYGDDVFAQAAPDGLVIVERPDHVTAFRRWRWTGAEWVLENS